MCGGSVVRVRVMCNGGVVRVLLCNFGGGVVITYTISHEITGVLISGVWLLLCNCNGVVCVIVLFSTEITTIVYAFCFLPWNCCFLHCNGICMYANTRCYLIVLHASTLSCLHLYILVLTLGCSLGHPLQLSQSLLNFFNLQLV